MKVFISWSGPRSKALAFALREWLPLVLQYVEPWVSEKDISAGERWAQAIAGELQSSNFGIICITPENLNSPWVLFEAGALSKSMLDAKVIPLLFGLELSDLGGPLSQFQAQKADEAGMMEIIRSINKVPDAKAAESIIDQLVPTLWPKFQQKMESIPKQPNNSRHQRPQHEILEELVTGFRNLNSRLLEFGKFSAEYGETYRKFPDIHPAMIQEMMDFSESRQDRAASLLMLAGILREQFPWLSELMVESYRELRTANAEEAHAIALRLERATRSVRRTTRSGSSKYGDFVVRELPHLIRMAVMPLVGNRTRDEMEEEGQATDDTKSP